MSNQFVKKTASMPILLGMVSAIFLFVSGCGSPATFAEVMDQLRTHSYEFEMTVYMQERENTTLHWWILNPGEKFRTENHGGFGQVVLIIDNKEDVSLTLCERFNVAEKMDQKRMEEYEVEYGVMEPILRIMNRPKYSVKDLFAIKVGQEKILERKTIAGQMAQGFEVSKEEGHSKEIITIWADAKTAQPLKIDFVWQYNEDLPATEVSLQDFKIVPDMDPQLFSMDIPAGYTQAGKQSLEQVIKTVPMEEFLGENTSQEAQKVLDALEAWADGNKQAAIDLLLTVDWKGDFQFSRENYLFTIGEKQFYLLTPADQKKVIEDFSLMEYRRMYLELAELERKAYASKDRVQAEAYMNAELGLAQLLNRNKDMTLAAQLVGIAIEKEIFKELSSRYEEAGETEKLQDVQNRLSELEEQVNDIMTFNWR